MITKVSHVTFFVLDQDKAYEFYVNKMGFKVNTDAKMVSATGLAPSRNDHRFFKMKG